MGLRRVVKSGRIEKKKTVMGSEKSQESNAQVGFSIAPPPIKLPTVVVTYMLHVN